MKQDIVHIVFRCVGFITCYAAACYGVYATIHSLGSFRLAEDDRVRKAAGMLMQQVSVATAAVFVMGLLFALSSRSMARLVTPE